MKKMTCAQMGGSCEMEVMGATSEEMTANGTAHMQEAHPEATEAVNAVSEQVQANWEATPETEEAAM